MSKFLKVKNESTGENVLIAVLSIAAVEATDKTVDITLNNGDVVGADAGFQAVSNRLKALGCDIE